MLLLHLEKLKAQINQLRATYAKAFPFPHIVIDNFVDTDLLQRVLDEFPAPSDAVGWIKHNDVRQLKLGFPHYEKLGSKTKQLIEYLSSDVFISFLENLSGITGLFPDPYYEGAGLHQIEKEGFLKVHADFNWHKKLQAHRRLNLLLYLNQNWSDEYGGYLELWDKNMTKRCQSIKPIFNRCVIFSTTDESYHGHPQPLKCPESMTRKSLALYYYSATRPESEMSKAHDTLFQKCPGENWEFSRPKKVSS